MDFSDLLELGAKVIQNNDDDATSNLDIGKIVSALGSILGSSEGGLDLGSIISKVSEGNFADIISSWIGSGENKPIEADAVSTLLGEEKIEAFAKELGVSVESAKKALADALPELVDKATNDESVIGSLLEKVGGIEGALDLASKFFKS